jgi:glycosyltransferase involved in cell wall biosynthesis
VAAGLGGVPEAVGDAGILVRNPDDIASVAQAIANALERETYEELRSRVSQRIRTCSWSNFIVAFERWHHEVAESKTRKRG